VITVTWECFGLSDRSEKFLGAGVTGWLQLGEGWQSLLTTTKNGINDRPAWDALMDAVFRRIRPLLVQVQQAQQTIIFQDIALQLEAALNSGSRARIGIDTALQEERKLDQREEREFHEEPQRHEAVPKEEKLQEPGENGPRDETSALPAALSGSTRDRNSRAHARISIDSPKCPKTERLDGGAEWI
jgi:hypothetical protein